MRVVREGYEMLDEITTGSRTGQVSLAGDDYSTGGGTSVSSDAYERDIERRMERQLAIITRELGIEPVDAELDRAANLSVSKQLVAEYVNQVDDRQ